MPVLVLLDMIFFITTGFFIQTIYVRVLGKISYLTSIIEGLPAGVINLTQSQLITKATAHFNFVQEYNKIYYLFLLLVFIIFFIYIIIQGLSWSLVTLLHRKKQNFLRYLYRFSFINSLWFLIILVIAYFLLRKLAVQLSVGLSPLILILLFFLGFILLYFILISYPLISQYPVAITLRKTFGIGFRKFSKIGLMYLVIGVAIFIVDILLRLLAKINPILMFIFGLILVLPLFTWIRLLITNVVLE